MKEVLPVYKLNSISLKTTKTLFSSSPDFGEYRMSPPVESREFHYLETVKA